MPARRFTGQRRRRFGMVAGLRSFLRDGIVSDVMRRLLSASRDKGFLSFSHYMRAWHAIRLLDDAVFTHFTLGILLPRW